MLLRKGGRVKPEALTAFLEANGYGRTGTVMEPGEYAVRGGIIDLYPAGESDPVRLDLFGDEIESLRRFDTGTQRSGEALAELLAAAGRRGLPRRGLDHPLPRRLSRAVRQCRGRGPALCLGQRRAASIPGMEHWAGLFHERMETLLDYLPGASVSLDHQADDVLTARLEMIEDHYQARRVPVRVARARCPTARRRPAACT